MKLGNFSKENVLELLQTIEEIVSDRHGEDLDFSKELELISLIQDYVEQNM